MEGLGQGGNEGLRVGGRRGREVGSGPEMWHGLSTDRGISIVHFGHRPQILMVGTVWLSEMQAWIGVSTDLEAADVSPILPQR